MRLAVLASDLKNPVRDLLGVLLPRVSPIPLPHPFLLKEQKILPIDRAVPIEIGLLELEFVAAHIESAGAIMARAMDIDGLWVFPSGSSD